MADCYCYIWHKGARRALSQINEQNNKTSSTPYCLGAKTINVTALLNNNVCFPMLALAVINLINYMLRGRLAIASYGSNCAGGDSKLT